MSFYFASDFRLEDGPFKKKILVFISTFTVFKSTVVSGYGSFFLYHIIYPDPHTTIVEIKFHMTTKYLAELLNEHQSRHHHKYVVLICRLSIDRLQFDV